MIITVETVDVPQLATNPFVVETPEKLSPQEIVALFIEKHTPIETLKQRKHTFIWGSRGSGKSMMARYLEPRCQHLLVGGLEAFFQSANPYLAIYCPCKEGHLNRSELQLLDRSSALTISEHAINLLVADRSVACLRSQFPPGFFEANRLVNFARRVVGLFDRASIAASLEIADATIKVDDGPLEWLQAILDAENRSIARYLQSLALHRVPAAYTGATSGYHDFLLPFFRLVKSLPKLESASSYILLDDADRLTTDQQSVVNEWMANRDHAVVCLKVSSRRDHYRTMTTRSGSTLEQPHDYSEIDVDELYTRSKSEFWEKVRLISDKRLELAKLSTRDIREFLPADAGETALLERMREEAATEWEEVGQPGRKNDFVHRYAVPRLFQHLRTTKKRKSYAGFDTLVDLSSGVVRDFLEPCYLMFDAVVSTGISPVDITSIPPKIQDDVIYRYSEEFLLGKFESLRQELPPEKWGTLDRLRTLVESLGRLFFKRLHDPDAREPRVFSFTVRGVLSPEAREVLALGEQQRYFQHRTYSSKEGGGRDDWYILNRRLCPVYKLDPSGFEGRVQLAAEMVDLACQDTDRFVRTRLKVHEKDQTALLPFEDENESDEVAN
ncbi:hypothetical protein [Lacipirellula sp.]|uniref:ORC-CDC6 family AAA ATPase n=1 Tax=Lacipirellula sp. TaxID=2691419 RepID=UPI003D124DA6